MSLTKAGSSCSAAGGADVLGLAELDLDEVPGRGIGIEPKSIGGRASCRENKYYYVFKRITKVSVYK